MRFTRAVLASLAVLASGAVPVAAQAPDAPLRRLQYLELPRAFPFAQIPAGALQRAKRDLYGRFPGLVGGDGAAAFAAEDGTWTPLGPERIDGRDAGRVSTVAIDPRDPSVLYAGGAQGGVWKTFDGGVSWRPLTDDQCSLAMGHIALDPANPDIVYAGTGELHFSLDSYYGCGLLRSLDAGVTWETLGAAIFDTPNGGARIARVLVDPVTAGSPFGTTIHVASSFGIHRSVDGGATWERVLTGVVTDLVRSPADPRTLYAAVGNPGGGAANGVYRSSDGGTTWTRLAGGFPSAEVGRIALAIAPSDAGVLYAAVQDDFGGAGSGDLLGIWKTTDGGATWQQLDAARAACGTQCWYNLVIAVHPQDPQRVYFGGISLYRSVDGGTTFFNILNGIHVDQHAIEFHPTDPSTVFVGNDGGVYRSRNGGTSWETLNTNLAVTQFYPGVSLHPTDAERVLGGTQDNGTLEYGGDPDWVRVLGADGGYTATDPTDPSTTYAETQWTAGSQFSGPRRRDADGGYVRKVTGIDVNDRALFIPPLVMDPTDPRVLYFGTFRLYRTADRAETWQAISGDLSSGSGSISAIAPAPSEPSTIWVGTSDGGVAVTRDVGATWTSIGALPSRYVREFDISLTNPDDVIVVFSGFGTGHVFRTTDGGDSWADISGDLPDVPVNAVLRHPSLGDRIVIGTDLGVLQSADGGASWRPYGTGMPNVAVFDLAYGVITGRLVAATHGRGTFAMGNAPVLQVDALPETLRFTALGDTATVTATVTEAGSPIAIPPVFLSLQPAVATVTAQGLVRSVGNGTTGIVAAAAGAADTVQVVVVQQPAAIAGLPVMPRLVVDEMITVDAEVVDAAGSPVAGVEPVLSTSDPSVLAIDGDRVTALRTGEALLFADADGLRDTVRVAVEPPATLVLEARDGAPPSASARTDTRVPLLRLTAAVDGIEDVRLTALTIDMVGLADGRLVLVRDTDDDGVLDPGEPVVGSADIKTGTTVLQPDLVVPADTVLDLIVAAELPGGTENGETIRARLDPEGTRTRNTRSGRTDLVTQPTGAVVSSDVRLSVLADGELLSFSENPVRSGRVIFNFATRPGTAAVYTLDGRLVADLLRNAEDARVEWDLTNETGSRVAPGVYLVVFEIDGRILRERLFIASGGDDGDQPSARRSAAR